MGTFRGYDDTNISSDTGVIEIFPAETFGGIPIDPGRAEDLILARLRVVTNDPGGGVMLVTVSYFDGVGDVDWNVSLVMDAGNYAEQGPPTGEIWFDHSKPLTIRVQPLSGTGSVDVRWIYKER